MRHAARCPASLVLMLALCAGCRPSSPAQTSPDGVESVVRDRYMRDLDSLVASVERLDSAVRRPSNNSTDALRERFAEARTRYKSVEYLVEYFSPATADGINGPALDDMDEDDPNRIVIPPEGFQVVEELLYPSLAPDDSGAIRSEVVVLLANVRRARYIAAATPLTRAAIYDAVRLQLMRIATLGLAGFDSPVALRGVDEAVVAMRTLANVMRAFEDSLRRAAPALADSLFGQFLAAERTLLAGRTAGFDAFDRLGFIVDHVNPLALSLLRAQQTLGVPFPPATRAWRPAAATVFAHDAFDPGAFAPAPRAELTSGQEALGRALFFDPVLSRGEQRSCATCHQPANGFADSLRTSLATVAGHAPLRNTPTVVNSALQGAYFADLRTVFLEDQVTDVLSNADEMHGSLDGATAAVAARPQYVAAFSRAFPGDGGAAVSSRRLRHALSAYLRSLQALDARFDLYVRGDRSAMSAEERLGFNVFMGKAKCGTCHFAPLFNGVVPPAYTKTESEVLGVPVRAVTKRARVDPDSGRARITRLPLHLHAFKTPTLRNVALTAPYMHNGAYRTLEEVITFYNAGGGAGIGMALPNQTLPTDSLRLSAAEERAVVAFLHTLTDTTSLPDMRREGRRANALPSTRPRT